jgi:putative tryptophan/tyrosine transport system substrate-binding protein
VEAFRAGLGDLGYVEGKNIIIEFRWAEGRYDRLPNLADELVHLKFDVLVTHGPRGLAAKRATATIPIVVAITGDAIQTGLVPSLARPGGNITGSSYYLPELMAKRLELLKETIPGIAEVAVLLNPDNAVIGPILRPMEVTTKSLKVGLHKFEARGPKDFEAVFSMMAKRRVDAIEVTGDAVFLANDKAIADLAAKNRIPWFAEAGGLIGCDVNFVEIYRRFVDKILKGANPSDLPVEQPTKFELVVNLKTARALGLTIPPSIMVRADEVIE